MTTDPLTVTHTVSLPIIDLDAALAALHHLPGVEQVGADAEGQRLTVTYHIDRVRFDAIEQAMIPAGAKPPGGLVNFLRRRWVRFTENNLLANAQGVAHTWYEPAPEDPHGHRPPERRHLDRPQGA